MSRENVEVVRAAYEAWNAGDMDALRELYDPDVIVRTPEGWPEPGPFVGGEAVMCWFEQLRETWDADALEPIGDFIDAGDRVAVRQIWRGAGYGPEANLEMTNVMTVRNGRIFYTELFWEHAEALETLGLSEQEAHANSLASLPNTSRAMSQRNVEIVRRIFDAWATGDFRAGADDLDQHVVFVFRPDFPEFGVFSGPAGLETYMRRLLEQWERLIIEAKQIQVVGDTVLAHVVQHGKGRASGIEVENSFFTLFTLRGGRIVRIEAVMDEGDALEAVGLSEQAMARENVEIVQHCYDLVGRGDLPGLVDLIGPEFELHENVLAPDAAVYRGPEGLRKWLESSQEAFTDFRFEAERFIERGDWVFAPVRAYGRGKGSGAPFTAQYVTAFKLHLGKCVFAASYGDLPEALEAAGLSE